MAACEAGTDTMAINPINPEEDFYWQARNILERAFADLNRAYLELEARRPKTAAVPGEMDLVDPRDGRRLAIGKKTKKRGNHDKAVVYTLPVRGPLDPF